MSFRRGFPTLIMRHFTQSRLERSLSDRHWGPSNNGNEAEDASPPPSYFAMFARLLVSAAEAKRHPVMIYGSPIQYRFHSLKPQATSRPPRYRPSRALEDTGHCIPCANSMLLDNKCKNSWYSSNGSPRSPVRYGKHVVKRCGPQVPPTALGRRDTASGYQDIPTNWQVVTSRSVQLPVHAGSTSQATLSHGCS